MNHEHLLYRIALSLINGLGSVTAKHLISYLGSEKEVFHSKFNTLVKVAGVGEYTARKIMDQKRSALEDAEKEIHFIDKNNIRVLYYLEKDYPYLLKQCHDAPLILYVKGNIEFNRAKLISIVGTRKATSVGKMNCERMIENLSSSIHKPVIVSGLAYGIDICAHRSALKFGLETIAVMGHGFNRIYPQYHEKFAYEIIEHGALISDFTSTMKFEPQNFLKRNRIIAGISEATIVIESGIKGGSLTTAEIANSYNREVFAVPGRLEDKYSEGCNYLIKTNNAFLLQSYEDIPFYLNWSTPKKMEKQQCIFVELTQDENTLAQILSINGKFPIDLICKESKFNMSKVSSLLLEMEFKGLVRCFPGKVYELTGILNIKS
jgi:DNA processing protein